jgi:hypothetical protein
VSDGFGGRGGRSVGGADRGVPGAGKEQGRRVPGSAACVRAEWCSRWRVQLVCSWKERSP